MRYLGRIFGQGLIMKIARLVRIQAEIELVFPAEFKARFGQRIVTDLRTGVAFGQVGGMCRQLVGNDTFLDIVLIG